MNDFEKKVIYALEQWDNGDPIKDFLDDDEIMIALQDLKWYIENYYD